MADYSGYFACSECGASGTHTSPAMHKDICSVPEKIAHAQRQLALRRKAEEKRYAEQRAHWDSLGDDELFEKLRAVEKTADDYATINRILMDDFNVGMDVISERGLVNEWLRKS